MEAAEKQWKMTPEEKAEKIAMRLTEMLDLNEEQRNLVFEVNVETIHQMRHLKREFGNRKDLTEAEVKDAIAQRDRLLAERNERVREILTAEQVNRWEEQQAEIEKLDAGEVPDVKAAHQKEQPEKTGRQQKTQDANPPADDK